MLQKAGVLQTLVLGEQVLELGGEHGITGLDPRQPRGAVVAGHREGIVQVRTEYPPTLRGEWRHGTSPASYARCECHATADAARFPHLKAEIIDVLDDAALAACARWPTTFTVIQNTRRAISWMVRATPPELMIRPNVG